MRKLLAVAAVVAAFGVGNVSGAWAQTPWKWANDLQTATHYCIYHHPARDAPADEAIVDCAPLTAGANLGRAVCHVTKTPFYIEASCTPGVPGTLADTLIVIPTDW
jgi:hypothetical protein